MKDTSAHQKPAQLLRSKSVMWLPDATGPIAIVNVTDLTFHMNIMYKLKNHTVKTICLVIDMHKFDNKEVTAIAEIAQTFKQYGFNVLTVMTPADCLIKISGSELHDFYEATYNKSGRAISGLLNQDCFSSVHAFSQGTLSENVLGKTYHRLCTEGDKARALTFHANATLNILCTVGHTTPRDVLLKQFAHDHKGSLDNVVYVDASSHAQEIVPLRTVLDNVNNATNTHGRSCVIC